mmetsp:Transcript_28384/g.35104  ORF Transcript_28384/g.35104 Transcript_28384/m.35104 type:complete len:213 (+) Transcript_28384:94-732(+)
MKSAINMTHLTRRIILSYTKSNKYPIHSTIALRCGGSQTCSNLLQSKSYDRIPIRHKSTGPRIRRRRGGGVDEGVSDSSDPNQSSSRDGGNEASVVALKDKTKFLEAAKSFLSKAIVALEPMKAYNDVFELERCSNDQGESLTIRLKPSEGQYILQVDDEVCTLTLQSPMSGNYTYVLCAKTNSFVGMIDNHSLVGMLVRDLIRHCNGIPQF